MTTINLLLELTERHEIRVSADDHDSHEWAKARSVECEAVMAVLQDRFIGRPIALSHDGDVKNMRHHLAILLHEAFPGVGFNIRARMPVRETVVRMREIR